MNLADMRRVAVGSRSGERAAGFAAGFGFERSYGRYMDQIRAQIGLTYQVDLQ